MPSGRVERQRGEGPTLPQGGRAVFKFNDFNDLAKRFRVSRAFSMLAKSMLSIRGLADSFFAPRDSVNH